MAKNPIKRLGKSAHPTPHQGASSNTSGTEIPGARDLKNTDLDSSLTTVHESTVAEAEGVNITDLPTIKPAAIQSIPSHIVDHVCVYCESKRVHSDFTIEEAIERVEVDEDAFLWLSLNSPTAEHMMPIAELFGIHSLTVEDIVHGHQRPKLEVFPEYTYIVARTVHYNPTPPLTTSEFISTNEMHTLVGSNFVITILNGKSPVTSKVHERLDKSSVLVDAGPGAVAYGLLDWTVDEYMRISQELELKVEAQETEVFTPNAAVHIEPIYMLKRENLEMRHAIDPLTQVLKTLSTSKSVSSKTIRSLYSDVLDHQYRAADQASSNDERLSTLIDSAVAKVSLQQNTDMRKISAWAAIAVVPTMIAGIYGMNFENMPELKWHFGYFYALTLMFAVCAMLWWVFRRNKWL